LWLVDKDLFSNEALTTHILDNEEFEEDLLDYLDAQIIRI